MIPIQFLLLIVIVVVVLVVSHFFGERKRKERELALQSLADEMGWRFNPSRQYDFDDEFYQFSHFRQGYDRYAYNQMEGALPIDGLRCLVQMGDFHYKKKSQNGKSSSTRTYRFSYLIVRLPYANLPSLTIRRESFFDRMAAFMGFDDIDFESAEFSNRFHVKSSDKRFAYDVIHPHMMEYLMQGDPPTIDIQEGACCLVSGSRCWAPGQFRNELDWIRQFFDLWPSHLTSMLQS